MKKASGIPQDDTKNLLCIKGHWYLRAMINGIMVKQSLRTTNLAEARILRDERLASIKGAKDEKAMLQSVQRQLDGITVEEERRRKEENLGELLSAIWKKYESNPANAVSKRVMDSYRQRWNKFMEWMQENNPMTLHSHQVTRQMAQDFVDYIWESGLAPTTYNKYISTLTMLFNDACDRDDDLNNPFSRIKKAKQKSERRDIFTETELRAMFADDNAEFVRFCAVGLYTTQRLDVARKITWEQFTDDLSMLYVTHHKTDADGSMTVPAELKEILERVPKAERHGYLFPTYATLKECMVCFLFKEKLTKLGITTTAPRERGIRAVSKHGYHSFRHTAITRALSNGASSAKVKRLAGHSTTAMQEHYTHMGMEDAGEAASLIGKFW